MARFYDRTMAETEAACLSRWRSELLAQATGAVLEVGAGTGANLEHYPAGLTRLVLAEPDPHMRAILEQRRVARADAETTDAACGSLPFEDASFDTVVSTLVLCTVPDQRRALADLFRVLRPGGELLFIEHVLAENRRARRMLQRVLNPGWKLLAGGCHCTRRTDAAICAAGFRIDRLERESMRKAFPWVRPSIRGTATRPS